MLIFGATKSKTILVAGIGVLCVCVCVCARARACACVRACVCACVCAWKESHTSCMYLCKKNRIIVYKLAHALEN